VATLDCVIWTPVVLMMT